MKSLSLQKVTLGIAKVVLLGGFFLATLPKAMADDAATATTQAAASVSPWDQCAGDNGITVGKDANGKRIKLTDAQKATMNSCMKPKREAAAQECKAAQANTKDWKAFHECMKAKGFKRPHHGHLHDKNQAEESEQ